MAETSVNTTIDGGPPGGTITKDTVTFLSTVDDGENGNLIAQFVIANEIVFKGGKKESKTNPIRARIQLLIINILTKFPTARITTMKDEHVKIETMPTDDKRAARFFDFDPEKKQRTGRVPFGLKVATPTDNFWEFKRPLFEFLKTNNIMMFHHELKTTSVQFSRIGCLIKIDPNTVHFPSMEKEMNNKIKTKWLSMSTTHQKALFPAETIA